MSHDEGRTVFWRQQPLGKVSDRELGRTLGCHPATVGRWRKRFGIPPLLTDQVYQGAVPPTGTPVPTPEPDPPPPDAFGKLSAFCTREPRSLDDICDFLDCGPTRAQETITAAQSAGHPLQLHGDHLTWHSPDEWSEGEHASRPVKPTNGWFQVAVVSDTHFGSKTARHDFLADFFGVAYARGCRQFFHCGDMLDGEYRHGLRELSAHGFDEQAAVAAEYLPAAPDALWDFVDGNHDVTLSKASGAVSGRAIVERFASYGRHDVTFNGQRRGTIRLANEGYDYQPLVELWHPKRGKAYADSYGLQKKIEKYRPGCKPDILLVGHWHAFCYLATRGVHAIAVPCFQGAGSEFSNSLDGQPVIGGVILNYGLTAHGTLRHVSVELVQYYEQETPRTVEVQQQ